MEKVNIVLVMLNRAALEETLQKLNLSKVNLVGIVADTDEKKLKLNKKKIPMVNFFSVNTLVKQYKDDLWLISGCVKDRSDITKAKKFLMTFGVPEEKIINLEVSTQISRAWLANLRYIEERGAIFFATGNEYTCAGLNLNYIPAVRSFKIAALGEDYFTEPNRGGIILSDVGQDLRQSFLIAKHVFKKVPRGRIKFVIIGLSPYSFRYVNDKDFVNQKNLQYLFALNPPEENLQDLFLKNLLIYQVRNIFTTTTSKHADLNLDDFKKNYDRDFSINTVSNAEYDEIPLSIKVEKKNIQILRDYIELCLANGAKPIGVVFPYTAAARKHFDHDLLKNFRETIHNLEVEYDFTCVDMFERFNYHCFCDMTHLNATGTRIANSLLAFRLYKKKLIPLENFCDLTYSFFNALARIAPKKDYNAFSKAVFDISVKKIRLKDKIKVGFVLIEAAQWCGDDLYKMFANNPRFEVTVFFSLDFHKEINELIIEDFLHGTEQFKSHGVNVVTLTDKKTVVPEQDVLIFLTPYLPWLHPAFHISKMTVKTLITHILYGIDTSSHLKVFYNQAIFILSWKAFISSVIALKMYKELSITGMPGGVFAGCPKIDFFFKQDSNFNFDWKMARPDAKKIIWAPHHSIIGGPAIKYATFQWNYKFLYEFAKNHPEISWVVKPHPWLLLSAVSTGLFSSEKAFEAYLQAWNDLPNARVYTGAYYQDVFATSDGMIHDSCSFTAEYQYANQPMIYLTRETQKFNKLGEEILKASYLVDGQDLEGIAATIKRVFIDGDDYKSAERKKVFDKYLNYPKFNGMLASEFIYRSIADALKPPTA